MEHAVSFGKWVRRRRTILEMTQADLARRVPCSLSMLRKIERDERRPSEPLAELLADHLSLDVSQRDRFMLMARGRFVPDMPAPARVNGADPSSPQSIGDLPDEHAPYVGREDELQRLNRGLVRALGGHGEMIFVGGEAGRGKTSLLHEFARQALNAHPDLVIAGGASDVYTGVGDPLLPFRDIFRLLAADVEHAGMRGIISRELVARLTRALPATSQILLDQGPHLIDTVVPGAALEAQLAQLYPNDGRCIELLERLRARRARLALPSMWERRQERLFDEISTTFMALANQHPILLLLDDLHWVDTSTAGLLGHLASRLRQSAIFVVSSFRPEDLVQGRTLSEVGEQLRHPLQNVLDESRRLFGDNQIDLDYSDAGKEFSFVNALLDQEPNKLGLPFRQQLADITQGNALFTVELFRDMKERGDLKRNDINLDGVGEWIDSDTLSWEHFPARMEGVIEKRISRLPDDLREILNVASVQGELFAAEVFARVRQVDAYQMTRSLSTELDRRHRLIWEEGVQQVGAGRLSQYRFRHQLFQKYLYDQLGTAERIYLHEVVANALEALFVDHADADDRPTVHLARHFEEAGLNVKSSHYYLQAGRNAARITAFDEGAAHLEHGLSLLQKHTSTPETRNLEFEITLELARAYWHGGHVTQASSTYESAIKLARSLGSSDALARSVLAYEEPRWRLDRAVETSQYNLREALVSLGDEESGLRVRLLVRLARARIGSAGRDELRAMVDQALALARRVDDPVALCDALHTFAQLNRDPNTVVERLAVLEELVATAHSIDDRERLADAYDMFVYEHLELGNSELVDEGMAQQKRIAEEIKQPFQLHIATVFQTMRSILHGDFDAAERSANAAATIAEKLGIAEQDGIFGIHMFTIRAEQGRLGEIAPIVKLYMAANPVSMAWKPGLALIYAAIGERERCQAVLDELAADDFAQVPRDSMWITSLVYLAEAAVFLNDAERSSILYDLLLLHDGRAVVAGLATLCLGATARYLGMLATVNENWSAAECHFEGALVFDANLGAHPWLAHSQYEYAMMLLERDDDGDRERAIRLLEEAERAVRSMGMVAMVEKVIAAKRLHLLG